MFNLVLGQVGDSLEGYLEKKQKQFTATYMAKGNVESFGFTESLWTNCLYLSCAVDAGKNKEIAMEIVLQFKPLGGSGITVKPLYLDLKKAAALTGKEGLVDFVITVGVDYINNLNQKKNLIAHTVSLPGHKIGDSIDLSNEKNFKSSVFPRPEGIFPASVAITITETGSGSKQFGNYVEQFKTQKSVLLAAFGEAFKTELTQE